MVVARVGGADPQSSTGSNVEAAKPQTFYRLAGKVSGFLMACKLFIRMRMREVAVEEQIVMT